MEGSGIMPVAFVGVRDSRRQPQEKQHGTRQNLPEDNK
jgi:hypothetical protein